MDNKQDSNNSNECNLLFLKLRPCSKTPVNTAAPDKTISDQEPNPPKPNAKIEHACKAFLDNCFFETQRNVTNQKRLINKPAFIIEQIDGLNVPNAIFALLCDQRTLFSRNFANYMLNYEAMKKNRSFAGTEPRAMHQNSACVALAEYKRLRPRQYEQNKAAFEDTLNKIYQYRSAHHNSNTTCYQTLTECTDNADDGQEATALLTTLKQWDPTIPLNEANVFDFYAIVFMTYRLRYYENTLVENESGNYTAQYSEDDELAFQEYEKQRKACIDAFHAIQSWVQTHPFPAQADDSYDAKQHFSEDQIKKVSQLLREYLKTTRTVITTPEEQAIVQILQSAMVWKRYAAFRFLVLCVWGSGAIFKEKEIDWEQIRTDFSHHVYRAKPARSTQRTQRLILLCGLCNVLQMDRAAVQDNLLYFLLYHGFEILSKQEAQVWEKVLTQYNLQEQPTSFAFRCWNTLQACLPFSFSDLFCYRSCSQLHFKGFDAFCKTFPKAVSPPSALLDRIPDNLTKWYLSQWESDQPDIPAIREKLCTASNIIEQTDAMAKWIAQWDAKSKQGKHQVPYPIDQTELRSLLLECAIRRKIINQAYDKLRTKLFDSISASLQSKDSQTT
nr:hypothetical protein [uncultured Agathobaculum sp.]